MSHVLHSSHMCASNVKMDIYLQITEYCENFVRCGHSIYILLIPQQYLDMLIPCFSGIHHGWFGIYPTFVGYFKVYFFKCHNEIPVHPNLQLMTIVVKILSIWYRYLIMWMTAGLVVLSSAYVTSSSGGSWTDWAMVLGGVRVGRYPSCGASSGERQSSMIYLMLSLSCLPQLVCCTAVWTHSHGLIQVMAKRSVMRSDLFSCSCSMLSASDRARSCSKVNGGREEMAGSSSTCSSISCSF